MRRLLDIEPDSTTAMSRRASPRKTAFVLSGGSSLGAIQVGMIQALMEAGIKPDFLLGTSVGAINATWLATQPDVEGALKLAEIWSGLRRQDVFPLNPWAGARGLLGRTNHVISNSGLRTILEKNLRIERLEETAVRDPCSPCKHRDPRCLSAGDHWAPRARGRGRGQPLSNRGGHRARRHARGGSPDWLSVGPQPADQRTRHGPPRAGALCRAAARRGGSDLLSRSRNPHAADGGRRSHAVVAPLAADDSCMNSVSLWAGERQPRV